MLGGWVHLRAAEEKPQIHDMIYPETNCEKIDCGELKRVNCCSSLGNKTQMGKGISKGYTASKKHQVSKLDLQIPDPISKPQGHCRNSFSQLPGDFSVCTSHSTILFASVSTYGRDCSKPLIISQFSNPVTLIQSLFSLSSL